MKILIVLSPFSKTSNSRSSTVVLGSLLQMSGLCITTAYVYNNTSLFLDLFRFWLFYTICNTDYRKLPLISRLFHPKKIVFK